MDSAVHKHYKEIMDNRLTAKEKEALYQTHAPGGGQHLQVERFAGDSPSQQGSGTATVLDNVSGQTNPNIIY